MTGRRLAKANSGGPGRPAQPICKTCGRPRFAQFRGTSRGNAISEPLLPAAGETARPSSDPHEPSGVVGRLTPVSPCPPLAFLSGIQSVDLFAGGPHILEASGKCGWCPCCSGAQGPPFDWISLLHVLATSSACPSRSEQQPLSTQAPTPNSDSMSAFSFSMQPGGFEEDEQTEQQQALAVLQQLRAGAAPAGAKAELSTLVRQNQLVFGGVQEINAAYSHAWLSVYLCMLLALLLPPVGWLLLLFLSFSAAVRRSLDEYVLYWMSKACTRVNLLLYPCGVAFMLLEGCCMQQEHAAASSAAAAALVDVESCEAVPPPPSSSESVACRVWALRVFVLPRTRGSRETQPESAECMDS
ncbi:hypothetical protein Efla_007700 [Eimeria flavescens]